MEEPKKDLKSGEEETPSGADLPEEETPESPEGGEEGASGATGPTGPSEPEGEEVKISKSELEQIKKKAADGENYRKALLARKGRFLPGSEPVKKPKPKEGEEEFGGGEEPGEEKFVTKEELATRDEKAAIRKACENEEIALNWDDIIVFYIPPKENTYEAKLAAIEKAHKLWRADKGITEKPEEEDKGKKDTKELATEKGLGEGKEKKPIPPKKHIIPRKEKMEDWFK